MTVKVPHPVDHLDFGINLDFGIHFLIFQNRGFTVLIAFVILALLFFRLAIKIERKMFVYYNEISYVESPHRVIF